MSKILLPLITLIALISLIFNFKFVFQKQNAGFKVTEVIDGDTFKIDFENGKRVRLLGIDAPELGRCLANEAKDKLTQLVSGKEVTLTDQFTDPYGRIMANVFVENVYVNKEMVSSGLARTDSTQNPNREELKTANVVATQAKLGLHSNICISLIPPTSPTSHTLCLVKGNVDNEKPYLSYLLPGCGNYSQAKIDLSTQDQWFCSEKEAIAAGFVKSSTCP